MARMVILQKLQDTLDEYFPVGDNRHDVKHDIPRPPERKEVHHYHYPMNPFYPGPLIYHAPQPPVTVINHNHSGHSHTETYEKEKKPKKAEKDESTNTVALVAGAGVALLGSYVIASDEYTTYRHSGIDNLIQRLKDLRDNELGNLIYSLEQWRDLYILRTKPMCNAKWAGFLSALGGATAWFYRSPPMLVLAGAVVTVSGVVAIYHGTTSRRKTEDQTLAEIRMTLKRLTSEPPAYQP